MQFLAPGLVGWKYFATPENKWDNWFHFIRAWAVPDPGVIPAFYAGQTSFFTKAHLTGWAGAIAVWTGFLMTLLFCFYCVATLVRRQWVENERLIFPIVQIPLEITRDGGASPLWSSRVFRTGGRPGRPAGDDGGAPLHPAAHPALFPHQTGTGPAPRHRPHDASLECRRQHEHGLLSLRDRHELPAVTRRVVFLLVLLSVRQGRERRRDGARTARGRSRGGAVAHPLPQRAVLRRLPGPGPVLALAGPSASEGRLAAGVLPRHLPGRRPR